MTPPEGFREKEGAIASPDDYPGLESVLTITGKKVI